MNIFSLLVGAVVLGTATVSVSGQSTNPDIDIPAFLGTKDSFGTLVASLSAAGLVDALAGPNGPFTVFAPTDEAFEALPSGLVECLILPENIDSLSAILKYHVVEGKVMSTDFYDGMTLTTLEGSIITFPSGVKVNDASVTSPDIEASNGVIHVIGAVLVPDTIDVDAFMETCEPGVPGSKSAKLAKDAKAAKMGTKSNKAPKA